MIYLLAALFILLLIALAAALAARSGARRTGLPAGQIIYSDTGFPTGQFAPLVVNADGIKQEKPLISQRYGLGGRPDYLVRTAEGIVPVEAKSARCPASGRPHDSHIMQLAAYCLLVEDVIGARVPYGLIRYRDCEVRIAYTPQLKAELIELLAEIRESRVAEEVHRSHDEAGRCAKCSFRDLCDETLTC